MPENYQMHVEEISKLIMSGDMHEISDKHAKVHKLEESVKGKTGT
jgi:hypothetical protein